MVMICQFVTPLAPPQIPPPLILQLLNLVSQILVIQHLVPRQPKRKRLKFKHELTRNILDLNYAKNPYYHNHCLSHYIMMEVKVNCQMKILL